jgi:hypothetical protein
MASDCYGSPDSRLDDGIIYIDIARNVPCAPCTMLSFLLKMEYGKHKEMAACETLAVRAYRLEVPCASILAPYHPACPVLPCPALASPHTKCMPLDRYGYPCYRRRAGNERAHAGMDLRTHAPQTLNLTFYSSLVPNVHPA